MKETDDDHLIALLFEAAGGDASWSEVRHALERHFQADGVDFILRDRRTMRPLLRESESIQGGLITNTDAVRAYTEEYYLHDELARRAYRVPIGQVWLQQDLIDQEKWSRNRTFNEWIRPQGICWIMGALGAVDDERGLAWSVWSRSEPFEPPDVQRAQPLLRHLTRAVHLHLRFDAARSSEAVAWGMLDQLADAAFALDDDGRILHGNEAAEGLRVAGIVGARAPGRGRAAVRAPVAQVTADGPILWVFRPVPPRVGRTGATAIAFVSRPAAPPTDGQLAELFELTSAESRVVRGLLTGRSLAEIAARGDVTVATCRSQLKAVFSKTHTRRQAELVAHVLERLPRLRTSPGGI